jgi:hypothetical protein
MNDGIGEALRGPQLIQHASLRRALDDVVYRASGDLEEHRDLGGGVLSSSIEGDKVGFVALGEFGLFAAEWPLALAICMPSRIRARMRSASNPATMARTLKMTPP